MANILKAKKVMSRRPKEEKLIYEDQETKNIWHEQSAVIACYLSRESKDGYESFIVEEQGICFYMLCESGRCKMGLSQTEGCLGEG